MKGLIFLIIMILMIITSIYTIKYKDLVKAVVSFSFVGLLAVVLFFMMQAPDVALTEAAIGTGLITIVFIIAIKKTKRYEDIDE